MRLTMTEVIEAIRKRFGCDPIPAWKMRRVADDLLERGLIDLQRVGTYRTVTPSDISAIADELCRLNWLPAMEAV